MLNFNTFFGSELGEDLIFDDGHAQIKLTQQLDILSDEYLEVVSKRPCALQAILSLHTNDAEEVSDQSEENKIELPVILEEWARQFSDEYNDENAQMIEGIGTDQDLFKEVQRLYFVDIAIDNVGEGDDES